MLAIYAITMFVSAALLFLVQPMFARMVLPALGGSPAVWNTTVVFYQAALLAGYLYAHAAIARLGARRQAALHVVLLLLPLLVLPIGVPAGWRPPAADNPIPWLLSLLIVAVGLPFFVVSISSPMLQTWFARTGHRAAADPYFLYAAGNAGSMLALLGYPALLEPYLRLADQSRIWAAGYGLLVVLTLACAAILWRSNRRGTGDWGTGTGERDLETSQSPIPNPQSPDQPSSLLTFRRRLRWVALAFVPSSLMLSVTTYLSANVAPVPLLWVIPLSIYLLTFILVFARRPPLPHALMVRALPIVLLPLVIVIVAQATQPIWLLVLLHLATFFIAAMVCHGALAADRPPTRHLTEFYLWLSVGGVLGGLFNALLAPLLFASVVEYPLALVLACLLLPSDFSPQRHKDTKEHKTAELRGFVASWLRVKSEWRGRWLDILLPLSLGALVVVLIAGGQVAGLRGGPLGFGLTFGVPAVICFSFSRRPVRYALGVGALFLAGGLYTSDQGRVLHAERSFFGIHRVLIDREERFHTLAHGGTRHGMQSLDPARRREPLSYYFPSGPIGQVFAAYRGADAKERVAAIGLGAGALACYSAPGQRWTFYEIDPSVERIARDPRYFTYLGDCAPNVPVVLGDARLSLASAPSQAYDLIVLDAYSSDTIPTHLLTREALALYLDKLAPGGLLAFHISNRYFDLKPVIGALARDAGLASLAQDDLVIDAEERARGKEASQWAVLARDRADLDALAGDPRWQPLDDQPCVAVWTDDFSSVLSVLRWR